MRMGSRMTIETMDQAPFIASDRLNDLRNRAGLSIKKLAVAMGYANASSIQRYLDNETYGTGYFHRDLVERIADALVGKGVPPITREEVWELAGPEFAAAAAQEPAAPTLPTFGRRDLPVYAAAMGGDGHVIITFDPIEYIERPSYLESVPDSYGVHIVGRSMWPAYKPGDVAYVHPRFPLARESDVVLFHTPPTQSAECIIKQLNDWDDRKWHLEQFEPARTFSVDRVDWPVCHRVLGKHNRR